MRGGSSRTEDPMEVGSGTDVKRAGRQRTLTQRNLVPITVLALGVLALAVLIWTDQVHQRQRLHFELGNAIADVQVRAATAHLWLEEATADHAASETDTTRWRATMARAMADLRDARRSADALLEGGPDLGTGVFAPPNDPELRARAERIGRLLSEWEAIVRERSERPEIGREGSALEQRSDDIFDELQHRAADFKKHVQSNKRADYIHSRRLMIGIFVAWSIVVAASMAGLWQRERRRREAEEALQRTNDALERKVAERTRDLSLELSEHRKTEAALRESETQLRRLSAMLLTAQEAERRRIATELHDELGHALVLIKLRLGVIRKALTEGQTEARDDCEYLAQSIDQLIEDIRRLTRDLRPTVLEDLGLAGALRWLAGNCGKGGELNVTASVMNVDPLIAPDAQIVLYRIIQEALTNAGKHAQAQQVSLSVDRHGDRLAFVVEDDGKGFDAAELFARSASERGLGLATMEERARMLGGSLSISSGTGKGTRITVNVPMRTEGGLR
jgi:signal transduction histidine kinase